MMIYYSNNILNYIVFPTILLITADIKLFNVNYYQNHTYNGHNVIVNCNLKKQSCSK